MFVSNKYLWNTGIFLFNVKDIIEEYEIHAKEILFNVRKSFSNGQYDLNFLRLSLDGWSDCSSITIDYAIFEKSDNLYVVHFNGHWSDLGSWESVWEEQYPDQNNLVLSKNVSAIECQDSFLLRSEDNKPNLVGLELKNIIAVAMNDAVLVADKNKAQDIKEVVSKLKDLNISQADLFL